MIVLVQHLGLVWTGTTTAASQISRDLHHRAIEVMAGAQALGEFVSLDAEESFAIEHWPLELYKLAQATPPGELQGKVALVTGGASGIGRAIADAFAAAVERFGGVDILVSNAGVASSAALEDTSLAEWNRNHDILLNVDGGVPAAYAR